MDSYSHIPALEKIEKNLHRHLHTIASRPPVLSLLPFLSVVVSALASLCYSKSKALDLPEKYRWRIVQCCAWTTEAMQWVMLLSCLANVPVAIMLLFLPECTIYKNPAEASIAIVTALYFIVYLHWLAIDMIDWIDGWMNSEGNSIVDGLQPFMLTRAAATNAISVALSPKPVLSLHTKPSLPPSSWQTDLHRQLPCDLHLKSSALSSARSERRSSWYSASPEHSLDAKSPTTPALSTSRLRRHSEPIPSLTPLKKLFDVHPSRPPLASEEVNPTSADSVLSLAAAASDSDGEELSALALAKTSWVRICVEQFEALQDEGVGEALV